MLKKKNFKICLLISNYLGENTNGMQLALAVNPENLSPLCHLELFCERSCELKV
jgi:hypothetical protein